MKWGVFALFLSIVLLPLSHHIAGGEVLQSLASLFDAAPSLSAVGLPEFLSSVGLFNPSGVHVRDAGLELEAVESTDLSRLVRKTRVKGTFYFEGWYVKLVVAAHTDSIAIIPGILLNDDEEYGFVMIANPNEETPTMHRYPLSEVFVRGMQPKDADFFVKIGGNTFTSEAVEVDLPGLKGIVQFSSTEPLPASILSPSIMGWFAYIPGMQVVL